MKTFYATCAGKAGHNEDITFELEVKARSAIGALRKCFRLGFDVLDVREEKEGLFIDEKDMEMVEENVLEDK
jgi:hypothetical protein